MNKLPIKLLLIITLFSGCSKVLDIEDLENFDAGQVWNDERVANAYLANIYSVFGNWTAGSDRRSDQLSGIFFPLNAINVTNGASTTMTNGVNIWNYTTIRLINQGIVDIDAGTLSDDVKNSFKAQAYFLRAYTYFQMVSSYGGVPYITLPQNKDTDELDVPRNSTKECFEFIIQDIDRALVHLPGNIASSESNWGRINGAFAKAFKARVLLYKASPQFNPTNPWDNAYWQDAYDATKLAYEELGALGYKLVENYSDIALREKNEEIIFPVINQFPGKTSAWDNGVRPGSHSRGPASACPTWEMIKAFPMRDGKAYNDPTGAYTVTESQLLQSYWKNRDPRFEKSVVWNAKDYPVAGTRTGYKQYTSVGIAEALDSYGVNPNAAERSTNLTTYTGFFILKNSKLSLTQAQVEQYDVDFVLMRFGEVMLNYAEAANEAGHSNEALTILKLIRSRAGIEPGTDSNYGLTAATREQVREAIMQERNIELCFEGFRFNDLRRWRRFDILHNQPKWGVESIAIRTDGSEMSLSEAKEKGDNSELTEDNFKYSLLRVPQIGENVNIMPETYYFYPIPLNIIGKTKNLKQNIDWGGTFDPTLN